MHEEYYASWISKPNNMGDVGNLRETADELNRLLSERDDAREQNAKLRDIAERAIWRMANGVCLPGAGAVRAIKEEGLRLRAELDQLKEGAK